MARDVAPRTVVEFGSAGVAVQRFGRAMGTQCAVTVVADSPGSAAVVAERLWAMLQLLEAAWSRFRVDSEVSRLNALCAGSDTEVTVAVSPVTSVLLRTMLWAHDFSEGMVDAAVLHDLVAAGYDAPFHSAYQPSGEQSVQGGSPQRTVGQLRLGTGEATLPAGLGVDPGGVGKGLAADLLTASGLASPDVTGLLVDLGGDISARGVDRNGGAWSVAVSDERQPHLCAHLDDWTVNDAGVATSSVMRRRWAGGHHLIDPRTRRPSDSDLVAVTVEADSVVVAEACAKSAVIAGSGFAKSWLPRHATRFVLTFANEQLEPLRYCSPRVAAAAH